MPPKVTAEQLAARLDRVRRGTLRTTVPRVDTNDAAPLSAQQRRLWFVHQLSTTPSAFNLYRGIRIRGELDAGALAAAIAAVAARHQSLRARFSMASGTPLQTFDGGPHRTVLVDAGGPEAAARLGELVQRGTATPFDLETGPPFRSTIVRFALDDHALLLTVHHIAADRWSLRVLLDEIGENYGRIRRGEPPVAAEPEIRYGDFARWQAGQAERNGAEALAYWRTRLAGTLPLAEFPADRRATPAKLTRTRTQRLTAETTAALRRLAHAEVATLFAAMLSIFGVLLARYSGEADLLVGVPVAGRGLPELDEVIGLFVNAVPIRIRIDEDAPFLTLVREVRDRMLEAQEHQNIPYEALVEELRPPRTCSGSPFFQTLFALQNTPAETLALGLPAETFDSSAAATGLDFNFVAYERDGGLDCVVEYNAARYDDGTIERVLQHFANLAAAALAAPSHPLAELDPLGAGERARILVEWNRSAVDEPPRDVRLHELFEVRARAHPERTAVVDGAAELTYGDLDKRANQLAHVLRARGVADGDAVGSCLTRTADMVVAVVAIMKAGAACVPLDPASPRERLGTIVAKAAPRVVLADAETNRICRGLPARLLVLPLDAAPGPADMASGPPSAGDGTSLAYILFTSGSTGEPQGVMLEHRGFINFVRIAATYGIEPADRVLQFMSLSFDVSTGEIWSTLCGGATLCLRDNETIRSPARFMERCAQRAITVCILPTVYFHELAGASVQYPAAALPETLRLVAFAGEAVRADLVSAWSAAYGDRVRLLNHYGPTEATIAVTAYDCLPLRAADAESMSIGRPIANLRCYVLDARLRPVPIGAAGELYLAGVGLARGYLKNPARTAERFVPDPFSCQPGERMYKTGDAVRYRIDGTLEYIGRTDLQVKIRGFRIELGEIETALERHPGIAGSVVRAVGQSAEKRLVAYVTARDRAELQHTELRTFLARSLPEYMLPARTVVLESFPLTSSGKIDRRALASVPADAAAGNGAALEGARNVLEVQLAGIFRDLLDVPSFSYEDDFFEHGGHSLLAARLLTKIESDLGERVSIRALFEAPTPRRLAERIIEAATLPEGIVQAVQGGTKRAPLFFLFGDLSGSGIYLRRLARRIGQDRAIYALAPHGTNGIPLLETPEAMAAHYAELIKQQHPGGPYLLAGYCNGGVVAYEIARQLSARGATVGPLVLIGSSAYGTAFRAVRQALRLLGLALRTSEQTQRRWFMRIRNSLMGLAAHRGVPARTLLPLVGAKLRAVLRNGRATVSAPVSLDAVARLEAAYIDIVRGYVPERYDGAVHLMWGDHDPPALRDPTMGWGAVTSDLTVHTIAGDHMTMVTGEGEHLIQLMRDVYAEWD